MRSQASAGFWHRWGFNSAVCCSAGVRAALRALSSRGGAQAFSGGIIMARALQGGGETVDAAERDGDGARAVRGQSLMTADE